MGRIFLTALRSPIGPPAECSRCKPTLIGRRAGQFARRPRPPTSGTSGTSGTNVAAGAGGKASGGYRYSTARLVPRRALSVWRRHGSLPRRPAGSERRECRLCPSRRVSWLQGVIIPPLLPGSPRSLPSHWLAALLPLFGFPCSRLAFRGRLQEMKGGQENASSHWLV
jgi:hypothetical protein